MLATGPRLALGLLALCSVAAAEQQRTPMPDLDVLYIERKPRYTGYAVEYDLKGRQGVPILVDNRTRKPLSTKDAAAVKRWPAAGETVTFTAHVGNRGDAAALPYVWEWRIDGKPATEGKSASAQKPGEEQTFTLRWKWLPGRHTVEFRADPLSVVPDRNLHNNRRSDATDAWSLIWAVDKVTYASFNQNPNMLGTRSFEDWAQWHIDRMNELFDRSPTPWDDLPRNKWPESKRLGWRPRVRCDRVVVVDNTDNWEEKVLGKGVNALAAGYDGAWPFGRREDCSEWASKPDWGLIHEWGHQLGLTDLYALDRPAYLNLAPDHAGDPLLMGRLANQRGTMMHGHGPTLFSKVCMGALMTQMGRRRGYYGDYYFNTPKQSSLLVLDRSGKPVPGAEVSLRQDVESGYRGSPFFVGKASPAGVVVLPNRPAGHVTTDLGYTQRDNPFGKINVVGQGDVLLVTLRARGHEEHAWLDITDFILAYWRGNTERTVLTLRTLIPPAGGLPAPSGLSAVLSRDNVQLTWQAVKGAPRYQVYRIAPDQTAAKPMNKPISSTTLTASLVGAGLHRFRVSAILPNGVEGALSPPVRAMQFGKPWGIAVAPDGRHFIRDTHFGQAVLQKADGATVGLVGSVHDHFEGSYDIAFDPSGRLLSAKWGDGYNPHEGFKMQGTDLVVTHSVLATQGLAPGQFHKPMGIAANAKGDIFVADTQNDRIQQFTPQGKFVQHIGVGDLRLPMKPAFDSQGRLYVADFGTNAIVVYSEHPDGSYRLARKLLGVKEPVYVALDKRGRVFVSGQRHAGVFMLDEDGKPVWTYRGTQSDPLYLPRGLAFDLEGNLLIVDEGAGRVVSVKVPD